MDAPKVFATVKPVPVKTAAPDGVTAGALGFASVIFAPAPRTTIPSPFTNPLPPATVNLFVPAAMEPVVAGKVPTARTPNCVTSVYGLGLFA